MNAMFPIAAAVAMTCTASPAAAQSVFDGTWKVDPATAQFGGKPIVRELKGGTYRCISCSTPWSVPADGAYHPVTGNPYVDSASVTVDGPRKVTIGYRKDGKVIETIAATLSADGKGVTMAGTDNGGANGTPVTYETRQVRVGTAPAGAHAISGSWRNTGGGTVSDAGLTVTMKTSGDALTMSYPTGESVTATFGGPAAPVTGDKGGTTMKLVRTGPSSFTATSLRDGKTVAVDTLTVAADVRTLVFAGNNTLNGSTATYTATKQ